MHTKAVEVVPIAIGSMRVMWDVPIDIDDGAVLSADVFLPERMASIQSSSRSGRMQKATPFKMATKAVGTGW